MERDWVDEEERKRAAEAALEALVGKDSDTARSFVSVAGAYKPYSELIVTRAPPSLSLSASRSHWRLPDWIVRRPSITPDTPNLQPPKPSFPKPMDLQGLNHPVLRPTWPLTPSTAAYLAFNT